MRHFEEHRPEGVPLQLGFSKSFANDFELAQVPSERRSMEALMQWLVPSLRHAIWSLGFHFEDWSPRNEADRMVLVGHMLCAAVAAAREDTQSQPALVITRDLPLPFAGGGGGGDFRADIGNHVSMV